MLTLENFTKSALSYNSYEFEILERGHFFSFSDMERLCWLFRYTVLNFIHGIWVIFFHVFIFIVS